MNGLYWLPVVSHLLIGFYFIFFGFWNIYHWKPMIEIMITKKIPSPIFLLSIAIGWQVILGFALFFGVFVKIAALLLIPFTLCIVFLLHPFWNFTGELRKQHMALFITYFTMILGTLLLLLNTITPPT